MKPRDNRILLYGGLLLVGLGFVILLVLTFALSQNVPSLFGQCVAVVPISQEIVTEGVPGGLFGEGVAGSEEIAATIRGLNDRSDVAAVVFVINSPGGSVVATHEIYDALQDVEKPKVAYFREVAASGGYYIATATDYIISDPDAITGSIGVIATLTDMSGLLEKVGVNITSVQSGAHKDIGSSFRPTDEKEREILQALINEVFEEFRGVVVESRGPKLNRVLFEEVLDGRILSGRQALRIGLVDAVGTKKDAIEKAAALAGMSTEDVSTCDVSLVEEPSGLFNVQSLKYLLETQQRTGLRYG